MSNPIGKPLVSQQEPVAPVANTHELSQSDDSAFLVDVRDVVTRMRDKSYSTLGEAFEDVFYDAYDLSHDGVVEVSF